MPTTSNKTKLIAGGAIVVVIGLLCLEPVRAALGALVALAIFLALLAGIGYGVWTLLQRQVANPAPTSAPMTAAEQAARAQKRAVGLGVAAGVLRLLAIALRAFTRSSGPGGGGVSGSDHWGMRG